MRRPPVRKSLAERFDAKWVQQEGSDCQWWTAAKSPEGYGLILVDGRSVGAHRVSYELTFGRIPAGLTIDHLCRQPSCVNPLHLEAVSLHENLLRGKAGEQTRRTHCPRGHAYSGDNLIVYGNKRFCRECKRLSRKPRQHKERGPHPHAWTSSDDAALERAYMELRDKPSFLRAIAARLGRTRGAVATHAYKLGITR